MQGPNRPYTIARTITPGTPLAPTGRGVFIACTVAGTQNIKLASGTVLAVPVSVGANLIDNICVIDAPAGGSATCVVSSLE